jgi:hypothetical protein
MHVYLFIQEYGVHDYMYRYKLKEEILNIHAPIICTNKRMDRVWCLASLSTISVISWRPVLVVEEVGVPGENHRPWASNW